MARRKSLNRRRSRRSLNVSGILNDDTNAYEEGNYLFIYLLLIINLLFKFFN